MPYQKTFIAIVISASCIMTGQTHAEPIKNGGFELQTSIPVYIDVPYSYGTWSSHYLGANLPPTIVTNPVKKGIQSLNINTMGSPHGSYVYQDLAETTTTNFIWKFSVFRRSGANVAELVANWDRSAGTSNTVSFLSFDDSGTRFIAWDTAQMLPFVLSKDRWHQVEVIANSASKQQTLLIDSKVIGNNVTERQMFPVQTILLGDLSSSAQQGDFVFDEVSVTPTTIRGTADWGVEHTVTCQNLTKGTKLVIPKTAATEWNCEDSGLAIDSADAVKVNITGKSTIVLGTAPWVTAHTVTCQNTTKGTSLTLPKTTAADWDCVAAGLAVDAGDGVKVTIGGTKK